MGMTLEIELGITGGEEDGVDNSDVDESKLYTQPEEVAYAWDELSKVSDKFINLFYLIDPLEPANLGFLSSHQISHLP